jgi:hypothetical protein
VVIYDSKCSINLSNKAKLEVLYEVSVEYLVSSAAQSSLVSATNFSVVTIISSYPPMIPVNSITLVSISLNLVVKTPIYLFDVATAVVKV